MNNIRFSIPNINNNDFKLVKNVFKSGWLTHGKYTQLLKMSLSTTLVQNIL